MHFEGCICCLKKNRKEFTLNRLNIFLNASQGLYIRYFSLRDFIKLVLKG